MPLRLISRCTRSKDLRCGFDAGQDRNGSHGAAVTTADPQRQRNELGLLVQQGLFRSNDDAL